MTKYDHSDKYCCLCGEPRNKIISPKGIKSIGEDRIIEIADFRPLKDGRWEQKPQMIVSFAVYRNGGTDEHTHICPDCLKVGIDRLKKLINAY